MWLFGPNEDLSAAVRAGIDISVASVAHLDLVAEIALRSSIRACIQLKIDTGLSRNGALPADWPALTHAARLLERAGLVRVNGLWSHFANAEDPADDYLHTQQSRFHDAIATAARGNDILEIGAYVVDRGRDTVAVHGVEVMLTAREFAVAWLFFSQPEVRISRAQIAGAIWANDESVVGRSIEQHVYKLRNRLGLRGDHGLVLRTVYGGGYTLERQGQRVEPAQRNAGSFAPA
ncbi:alanine racemase [Pandoraea capi]|uniref:Alanine racemase n=1 Tax=Pandoraea capi TaxID=2508286 RepID=A0ABY6VSX0_9BURK|nr:alanine racemase [Pandoraea capi]VVD84381.1 alanine racemase [Pandoraea capi]